MVPIFKIKKVKKDERPHILFLSRSKGIKISGVKLRRASNYAFMSYDIERLLSIIF